jgi:hypothetical protein
MSRAIHGGLLVVAISCAGCSTLGGSVTTLGSTTWDAPCRGAMPEIVQPLTDDSVVDCGFLALDAPDKDLYDIKRCARSSIESGKAYRFGYQNMDKLLGYCAVAARTPDGQLWSLEFYAPIDEVMKKRTDLQYNFNAKQCSDIKVLADRRSFFDLENCTEATDTLMSSLHDKPGG